MVDFGIAGMVSTMDIDPTEAGSLRYIAPEVLSGKNRAPTPALDIWAMGCIIYGMLHGRPAFVGKTKKEIIDNIKEGNYEIDPVVSQRISPEIIDLIQKMLTVDYKKRIGLFDIMTHPWLTGEKLPPKIDLTEYIKFSMLSILIYTAFREEKKQEENEATPTNLASLPIKQRYAVHLKLNKEANRIKRRATGSLGGSPVSPDRRRTHTVSQVESSLTPKKDSKESPTKKSGFSQK